MNPFLIVLGLVAVVGGADLIAEGLASKNRAEPVDSDPDSQHNDNRKPDNSHEDEDEDESVSADS